MHEVQERQERHILDDLVKVNTYYLAMAIIYAGCELVKMVPHSNHVEFSIICPQLDYQAYYDEYHQGVLQIADVKAFGKTLSDVNLLIRNAKRDGGEWVNPDYTEMLIEYEASRSQTGPNSQN